MFGKGALQLLMVTPVPTLPPLLSPQSTPVAVDVWERESTLRMESYLSACMSWWSKGSEIPTDPISYRKVEQGGQSLWIIPVHKREMMGTSQGLL